MGQDVSKPATQPPSNIGINVAMTREPWNPEKSFMLQFKGKDENYGKPPAGSLTEARAKKACKHINKELGNLLAIIRGIGTKDEHTQQTSVTFGRLFRYYIPISNKVVGLLLRARRWQLIEFPGEMLYQGQDDDVIIKLIVDDTVIPYSRRFDFSSDMQHQSEPDQSQPNDKLTSNKSNEIDINANINTVGDRISDSPMADDSTIVSYYQQSASFIEEPSESLLWGAEVDSASCDTTSTRITRARSRSMPTLPVSADYASGKAKPFNYSMGTLPTSTDTCNTLEKTHTVIVAGEGSSVQLNPTLPTSASGTQSKEELLASLNHSMAESNSVSADEIISCKHPRQEEIPDWTFSSTKVGEGPNRL